MGEGIQRRSHGGAKGRQGEQRRAEGSTVGGGWKGLAVLVPRPGDGRPVVPLIVSPIDLGGQRSGRGRREGRGPPGGGKVLRTKCKTYVPAQFVMRVIGLLIFYFKLL